jgi:hypothetical protein
MKLLAKNHNGWEVQLLTEEGWVNFLYFHTRKEANRLLRYLNESLITDMEFRVYESLEDNG